MARSLALQKPSAQGTLDRPDQAFGLVGLGDIVICPKAKRLRCSVCRAVVGRQDHWHVTPCLAQLLEDL